MNYKAKVVGSDASETIKASSAQEAAAALAASGKLPASGWLLIEDEAGHFAQFEIANQRVSGSGPLLVATPTAAPPELAPQEAGRNSGAVNMVVGGLFCVGGIVVTAVTYQAAAESPTGGHYVVAYGAIIWGGLQFFRGVYQFFTSGR